LVVDQEKAWEKNPVKLIVKERGRKKFFEDSSFY
jgi:hypothetical protein